MEPSGLVICVSVAAAGARFGVNATAAIMKNGARTKQNPRLKDFLRENDLMGHIANLDEPPGRAVTNFRRATLASIHINREKAA